MSEPILEVRHVNKTFPGVRALQDISITIERGTIHALVGENGAGKSTLIKAITGAYKYDSGEILFYDESGTSKIIKDPLETKRMGIAAAYQDMVVAPELTVGENFFLGHIPRTPLGIVDWNHMFECSSRILREYGIDVDPKEKMSGLTVSQQAMVTIAKLSNENAKLIIFDEPTALLPNQEVNTFFEIIHKLQNKGITIIYISHRLDEIMGICDRVTVLKDGCVIGTENVKEINEKILISMMVGRDMSDLYRINKSKPGEEILRVENLSKKGVFDSISFNLNQGEILGFFGLIGSGRTEVMRCLFGADRYTSGKIYLFGKEIHLRSVKDSQKSGIGLIPEDRREQGLALGMDIAHNINMADLDHVSKSGFLNYKKYYDRCKSFISKFKIKAYSGKQIVRNLSGGNQQKVVIAKVLASKCNIIIMDEPTVGVDVGAKQEIYQLMGDLVHEGHSILFVSSYLPELLGISDRIVVFHEGRKTGELGRDELKKLSSNAAEEKIMSYASGYMEG